MSVVNEASLSPSLSPSIQQQHQQQHHEDDQSLFHYSSDESSLSDAYFLPHHHHHPRSRAPSLLFSSPATPSSLGNPFHHSPRTSPEPFLPDNHHRWRPEDDPLHIVWRREQPNYYGSFPSFDDNQSISSSSIGAGSPLFHKSETSSTMTILEEARMKRKLPAEASSPQWSAPPERIQYANKKMNHRHKAPPARQSHQQREEDAMEYQRLLQKTQMSSSSLSFMTKSGRMQPTKCWDWIWALVFWIQFASMVVFVILNQPSTTTLNQYNMTNTTGLSDTMLHQQKHYSMNDNSDGFLRMLLYGGFSALCGTGMSLVMVVVLCLVFSTCKSYLVQTLLMLCLLDAGLSWGLVGALIQPDGVVPWTGFLAFFLVVLYAVWIWDRMSFCSIHVGAALRPLFSSSLVLTTTIATVGLLLSFGWFVLWGTAFVGVINALATTTVFHVYIIPVCLLFLWSFGWTSLVIRNVVQSIVASVVGTWWFSSSSSRRVGGDHRVDHPLRATVRSLTTSFGSLCLASLVMPVAQSWKGLCGVCCCCCSQKRFLFLERCNRWAVPYIGLFGYSFADAGEKAVQLLETMTSTIATQDGEEHHSNIISQVLIITCVVIGGSTGALAMLLHDKTTTSTDAMTPPLTFFVVGSVVGFVLSCMLWLGVVESCVSTVLVCLASSSTETRISQHHRGYQVWKEWYQQQQLQRRRRDQTSSQNNVLWNDDTAIV